MIALLLAGGVALADTLDEELLAAERAAEVRIARCKDVPEACVGAESALARAFLVRVTAASVLRGEVDRVSAANARLLDRNAVADWSGLLPADESTAPDPWVTALAAAAWAARATDAGCCETATEGPRGAPALRQAVLEVAGAVDAAHRPRGAAGVDARLGFERGLGVRVGLTADVLRATQGELGGATYRVGRPTVDVSGVASLGWWRPFYREGDNLLVGGLVLGGEVAGPGADDAMYAAYGYRAPGPVLSVGLRVADVVRAPLDRAQRVFFAGEAGVTAVRRSALPHVSDDGLYDVAVLSTADCGPGCPAANPVTFDLAAGIEWRPLTSVRASVSGRVEVDLRAFRPPSASVELRVGWASRRTPETVADLDAALEEVPILAAHEVR